jgi:S1-C subfamily serine protease
MARPLLVATLSAALLAAGPVTAEPLTKAEIARRGKDAVALVQVNGGTAGTAFCINSAGLFVTSERLVRGEKAEVTLVLDAGLKTQRQLPAVVVRADKDVDLALLRAAVTGKLPSLGLGADAGLTELADVVALGFLPAPDRKEAPAAVVTTGTVAALHRQGGELHRVQLDLRASVGTPGGPGAG